MKIDFSTIKRIYNCLGDEVSQRIYTDRYMHSCTGNHAFMKDMVLTTKPGQELMSLFDNIKKQKKEIIVYGAGQVGTVLYDVFAEYVDFFVDKQYNVRKINNAVIMSPDILHQHKEAYIVIALGIFSEKETHDEIYNYLINMGFDSNKIISFYSWLEDFNKCMYFDLPYINWTENFTFLDVGAYDGTNSIELLKYYKNNMNTLPDIIAIEPNKQMHIKIQSQVERFDANLKIIDKGVWDKTGKVKFKIMPSGMLEHDLQGTIETECVSIDELMQGNKVDMIKMDIEGSEYYAIKGAEHTIKKFKPILAISIYHKPEDIIELPKLILDINPNYKLYLRHYNITSTETVLYAL